MSFPPEWPADPGVADFDALQEDPARWIEVVSALGARYSTAPAVPAGEGTVMVALLGRELVIKLYPPFLRDHFAFERAMLAHLHGRLSLPTPRLVDSGEQADWPFLVMTQLPGTGWLCWLRKMALGLLTPLRPFSVMAKTPISLTAPKRFLIARTKRNWLCVSPSK